MEPQESSDQDLWVSWPQYHAMIEALCVALARAQWRFDHVLCLARGGLRIGDVISRVFDLPLAILATSSYRAEAGTTRGELNIAAHITSTGEPLAGHVLVVDDLVDSGITLEEVRRLILDAHPAVTALKTAVLWWKPCSKFIPDFYVDRLASNPWIHQPFEEYDELGPSALIARVAGGEL